MRRETGYCTNVHAGADLPQTRANLERFALDVKRQVSPSAPMGVGLGSPQPFCRWAPAGWSRRTGRARAGSTRPAQNVPKK